MKIGYLSAFISLTTLEPVRLFSSDLPLTRHRHCEGPLTKAELSPLLLEHPASVAARAMRPS